MMHPAWLSTLSERIASKIIPKLRNPEAALAVVHPGSHIFLGTACATPTTLLATLEGLKINLSDVEIFHYITTAAAGGGSGFSSRFRHKAFFVDSETRDAMKKGDADYIPISITHVPRLMQTGRIVFDAALVQVSPPDEHGFVSLGVSVDITRAALLNAQHVIAEVNPSMPRTLGDSFISVDEINTFVPVETPVLEYSHAPADMVAEKIARLIARIIEDGSTLQLGLGQIPHELLRYLTNRRDLGIHSDVITDSIVDLIEQGVITGRNKGLHRGKVVASFCLGTRRLYKLIDGNPLFSFHPIEYVCDPAVIAANNKMVSITQAFAIDLTGQICSDQFRGEFYSGVSTQPDFIRSVAKAPGGKSIICLPSTTPDGRDTRIRPLLLEGEGITIPRADVHYIVTEYGMAYLFGKSIRERALALIEIAHPEFRTWLLQEAKQLGYVRESQELRSTIAYPAEEERDVILKNGTRVMLRPARASDVSGLQELFYHLKEQDVYTRFFAYLRSLTVDKAEHLCNVDYDTEMAFVATIGDRDNEKIIGSSCYFLNQSTNLAEVAYMISSEWQGLGLGTLMQNRMAEYARARGIRGFVAAILEKNEKMRRLAQNSPNISMTKEFGVYEVTTLFEPVRVEKSPS